MKTNLKKMWKEAIAGRFYECLLISFAYKDKLPCKLYISHALFYITINEEQSPLRSKNRVQSNKKNVALNISSSDRLACCETKLCNMKRNRQGKEFKLLLI